MSPLVDTGRELPLERVRIHGHERAFVVCGQGPAILLLHGIGMNHKTWLRVIPGLSEHFTVVAPDLLGHGESDKPRADYSIAGYANAMRDLMIYLGIRRATVVGHSLGGGIAMQFAYQFPPMTERIVLVAAGGLGRTVNPLIRALAVPGAGPALSLVSHRAVRAVTIPLLERLARSRLPLTQDFHSLAEVYDDLADPAARAAFRHVLRAVVDWRGQVITMIDRAYLARWMPSLVVWGDQDLVIPVKHAYSAHELLPGSRLEIFPGAGHVPHEDDPDRFVDVLSDFIEQTLPARFELETYRGLLRSGHDPRQHARVIAMPVRNPAETVPEPA